MAYIDEIYGKQLEEALRGLVSRPALGQPWFGFHESEVPAGVLLFTATTHSRVLYADFWNYIQNKNLVKTEEEWQSIYNEQGWCPFYSDGDGIDTFRMPSAPLYLHGANAGDAGKYVQEGLPNISGYFNVRDNTDSSGGVTGFFAGAYGCFSNIKRTSNFATSQSQSSNDAPGEQLHFDASVSNTIYGASAHVTPETSKILFGVWAVSVPQQPIPDATVEGIISELKVASDNALEANAKVEEVSGKYYPKSGGVLSGTIIRNGFLAQNSVDTSIMIVRGGTDATSAFLGLCGKNHDANPGVAYLTAADGTNSASFTVNPNGIVRIAGKHIVRGSDIQFVKKTGTNTVAIPAGGTWIWYSVYSYPASSGVSMSFNGGTSAGGTTVKIADNVIVSQTLLIRIS